MGSLQNVSAQTATLNLRDFGAIGDGITDDGPALQQALDTLAQAGGGTLFVPAGRYAILTPVSKDFTGLAGSIEIAGVESSTLVDVTVAGHELSLGLDLVSEFLPKTGAAATAIALSGLNSFLIHDISFMGTPDVATDAFVTLYLQDVENATIHHCEFYGLSSMIAGGAIVESVRSGLKISQTKFLGSTGNSGVYMPVVENLEWKHVEVADTVFLDYGQRPELYGKTGYGAPLSWINVGNAAVVINTSTRREVIVNRVFLDEGGLSGLSAMPGRYLPASAPIDLIYISGLRMNVSNLHTSGNYLTQVQAVLIENSRYQWSHNADAAISLLGVRTAIIDRAECVDNAHTIRADAATGELTIIDSIYENLASQAQVTNVINTENPGEDPVQYVREQFSSMLGRAPDAAAHFYWSDAILRCGDDPSCLTNRRSLLNSYLSSSPNPTFGIEGEVTIDGGAPLADALITLSGSQSVTTRTDVQGRYSFSGLPTSGVYSLSVSKTHHTFDNPTVSISTPAGNQTVSFLGLRDRYTISGQVADASGEGLPNAVVTVTGDHEAAALTDDNGSYSFPNLPGGGNYTITASKSSYLFNPQAQTITDLSVNQIANFTLVTYSVGGRITKSDGSPIVSALVTLSGGANKSTTTDANGDYGFSYLPAAVAYTVTVSRINYTFAQPVVSFGPLDQNQTANFTGSPVKFTVSGQLTSDNVPLAGVTLTLSGSENGVAVTGPDGLYSFMVSAEGTYTLTPALTHYTFGPANITLPTITQDETVDFIGTLNRHRIHGRVTNVNNQPISGVSVALTGFANATTTTDTSGDFSFPNLAEGQSYTITPSLKYYVFNPQSRTFADLSSEMYAHFVLDPAYYSISGEIKKSDGSPMPGATVTLAGPRGAVTSSDANGIYSFNNLPAAPNYLVTVSRVNYALTPAASVIDLDSDKQANFTATLLNYQITGQTTVKGIALPGVSITITGPQTITYTTDADGESFFSMPAEQTYTVTPSRENYTFSPASRTFTNLSTHHVAEFTATLNPGVPMLVSHPDSTRAIAFDPMLGIIEPFNLTYDHPWSVDRRTRLAIFATNFELATGETAANVTADAQDASGRVYTLTVESITKVPGQPWLNYLIVRLSDDLTDVGDVLLRIKYRNISSNRVRVGIGHIGGGPADDTHAIPTPGSGP
ncbi:MAG TPA: carboxypeptidase regulatory-like domain-containing protein [Pyrinomonadaceae bacterium]|nr:carboxypeptidase regulatory-like domain-containing protein [Pyrinomonadaceae bacterium]